MRQRIVAICCLFFAGVTVTLADQPMETLPGPSSAASSPAPATGPPPAVPAVSAGACGNYRSVEQMVMQPLFVRTKRKVMDIDYREEPRRRIIRVMKPIYETKSVTREVTVLVPEKRTRTETFTVCKPVLKKDANGCCTTELVREPQTREVSYVVCVPKQQSVTVPITTCRYVPEQRQMDYVACVPVNVEREIDVVVCRMAPKKVVLQIPICPPACGTCCN